MSNNRPCIAPFATLTIAANGKQSPCCTWSHTDAKDNATVVRYKTPDDIKKHWMQMGDLREQFINNDYPAGCVRCDKRNEMSGFNRKQWYELHFGDSVTDEELSRPDIPLNIKQMDLNLSNKCNLRCRHCGGWGSTGWFKEDKKLNDLDKVKFRRCEEKLNEVNIDDFTASEDHFAKLIKIDFKGGEPLYQKDHLKLLNFLIERGYAKNIMLQYVTNGTIKDDKIVEAWSNFRKVKLTFSLEGTGPLYQYIRGGTTQTHQELEDNLLWYWERVNIHFGKKIWKFTIGFSITAMAMNVRNLPAMLDWIDYVRDIKGVSAIGKNPSIPPTPLTDPSYLSYNVLPLAYKQKVAKELLESGHKILIPIAEGILKNELEEPLRKELFKTFYEFNAHLDEWREQDPNAIIGWADLEQHYKEIK